MNMITKKFNRLYTVLMFMAPLLVAQSVNDELIESNEAFKQVERQLAPMSEDQIKSIKQLYKKINRATLLHEDASPTPTFSSMVIDLQPGSSPQVIRLATGYVTSLLFVDSSGAPWPIRAYDVGDPSAFNIVWNNTSDDKSSMTNTLMIQAMSLYKDGNLAVMLQGLNTPVILSLVPGQKEVDYRVDIQVPGMGPFAVEEVSVYSKEDTDNLTKVINNMPPVGSRPLKIRGGGAKAWLFGDTIYLRSTLPVVSPAWVSVMKGASGGVSAYELPKVSAILVLDNGRLRKLTVEGL